MRSEKLIIKTIMKAVAFENLNQFVANTGHILRKKFRSYGLASSRIIWPVSLRIMHACMGLFQDNCAILESMPMHPLLLPVIVHKKVGVFSRDYGK